MEPTLGQLRELLERLGRDARKVDWGAAVSGLLEKPDISARVYAYRAALQRARELLSYPHLADVQRSVLLTRVADLSQGRERDNFLKRARALIDGASEESCIAYATLLGVDPQRNDTDALVRLLSQQNIVCFQACVRVLVEFGKFELARYTVRSVEDRADPDVCAKVRAYLYAHSAYDEKMMFLHDLGKQAEKFPGVWVYLAKCAPSETTVAHAQDFVEARAMREDFVPALRLIGMGVAGEVWCANFLKLHPSLSDVIEVMEASANCRRKLLGGDVACAYAIYVRYGRISEWLRDEISADLAVTAAKIGEWNIAKKCLADVRYDVREEICAEVAVQCIKRGRVAEGFDVLPSGISDPYGYALGLLRIARSTPEVLR